MANEINQNGLTIQTLQEIITEITEGMQEIYGTDIIVDSNSPDGQMINLMAQVKEDLLEVVQMVNANFDPDQASGVVLDQRVSLNNIERRGANYTYQNIQVTVDRALNLVGLDADADDPDGTGFTVSDNNGNEFILLDSQSPASAGTYEYLFRAKELGAVETTPNTITEQVTIVLGVTAVNNSAGAEELGQNEETDAQLRLRRQRSVANSSNGYLNGLLGLVLNLTGVTDAALYENVTNAEDADGIPAHGIWLVADGGANSSIAELIYERKSYGANMKGDVEVDITTASNQVFTAKFDRPSSKELYIQFDIRPLKTGQSFDTDAIKSYIVSNLTYSIGQAAEALSIAEIAQDAIDFVTGAGSGAVENLEISDDDMTYVYYLEVDTLDEKWIMDAARITTTIL